MPRRWRVLLVAVAVAGASAACGGDDDDGVGGSREERRPDLGDPVAVLDAAVDRVSSAGFTCERPDANTDPDPVNLYGASVSCERDGITYHLYVYDDAGNFDTVIEGDPCDDVSPVVGVTFVGDDFEIDATPPPDATAEEQESVVAALDQLRAAIGLDGRVSCFPPA